MKKFSYLIIVSFLLLLFLISQNLTSIKNDISIHVVYPTPSETIQLTDKPLYLFGMLYPKDAQLSVNGVKASVDEDGAFMVYSPVIVLDEKNGNGDFKGKFVCKITTNETQKEIERFVWLKPPHQTYPLDFLGIDKSWIFKPNQDITLQPGEQLNVEFKATPGCTGFFTVDGIDHQFPIVETEFINSFNWADAVFGEGYSSKGNEIKGIYKGHCFINRKLQNAKVSVNLTHPQFGKLKETALGTVSTIDNDIHRVVKVKYTPDLEIGRFSPNAGYKLFLQEGVKLEVIGKRGNWLKAKLSNKESVFIPSGSVYYLPEGTPPPSSSIEIIRTKDFEKHDQVELGFSDRHPVQITQYDSPQKIELLVYNVTSSIDWIFYDKKSDFIKEIKYSQPEDNVLKVEIFLNQKTHWGYSSFYDGNIFKLKINKPAKKNNMFLFWENQLEGRVISIDAGHSSDDGAIGPRGTKEKNINYEISNRLKEMLEDAGAVVYMTRGKYDDLPLNQRKTKTNSFHPEISLSIHNNAVPQSVNPLIHNGSSVYYFYPQALPLAKLIHGNLLQNLKLNDFGLYWDNLYMTRIPESISILIEPAFMIVPEQEKELLDEDFQDKIAESIYDALETFYKEYSE